MPKLYFNNSNGADGRAMGLHNQLIASSSDYAASVSAGQTVRWSNTRQDMSSNSTPLSTNFYLDCVNRCLPHLTGPENARLVPYGSSPGSSDVSS